MNVANCWAARAYLPASNDALATPSSMPAPSSYGTWRPLTITVREGAQASSSQRTAVVRFMAMPCTAFRSLAPQRAWLRLQLLHVRALRRREMEQRIGQALIDLRLAEDDLVHVSLGVGA